MKTFGSGKIGVFGDFAGPLLAAVGFVCLVAVFAFEAVSFRDAVVRWAESDLAERSTLAASSLLEPLETGDFSAIHEFGAQCSRDGMRLTVFSSKGGLVFDSMRADAEKFPEIYASAPCGEYSIRLGVPRSRVLAPFHRARLSFALAALAGGSGVLLVFFFTYRQRVRIRELARLERFRREFIADFSHELKTPLAGIMGAADLLGDDPPDEPRKRLVAMMRRESSRLNDLAQSMLGLARLERNDGLKDVSPVDVSSLVEAEAERIAPRAESAGMKLSVDVAGPQVINGDVSMLEKAVSNLLENAVRHSGAAYVVAGTRMHGDAVEVFVEDHGRGISPEHAKRVFERFYRVDSSRESTGSGLGLAIVKKIAELHGGRVALSRAEPTGARFSIFLPKAKA